MSVVEIVLLGLVQVLLYAALFGLLYWAHRQEQPKAELQTEPAMPSPKKPKPAVEHADLDRERAELLKQLELAEKDPNEPLDPMVVEAQRQEIEANYQRQLAERKS